MEEKNLEFKEQIFDLINNKCFVQLKEILSEMQPADIAEIFEEAKDKEMSVLFRMLMGTGGNSGSQTSVSVIRALSLGDIEFRDILRVIWKELRVAVIVGIVLGVINFIKLYLVDFLWLHTFDNGAELMEMATICLTLILVIIVAKILGAVLPMVAKKCGLDPAVMASPLVTTILDAVSLLIYFGIAAVLVL